MNTDTLSGANSETRMAPFGLGLSLAALDRATRLANAMFSNAGASIILVHKGEVWRSRYADVLPREDPVTEAILMGGELFWVADGKNDPRFANHPLVTGPPYLRFLVAVPIRLKDGSTPGVLSISGLEPHAYDKSKAARLRDIADFVADEWSRVQAEVAREEVARALLAAKREADAANRAKSAFLATMSHELRTPLNAILGFAEVIKEQIMGPAPAQYVDYARDIFTSGKHLLDLVNDVLDISKLEAGKVDLHESDFGIAEMIEEVVGSFRRQAEAANISLAAQIAYPPVLRADKRLLKQVLLNLISNALKFTADSGRVTVSTKRIPGAGFAIAVSDTGIGMSPEEIEVALTPFGQVDSSVARLGKGTGLGLPISRALMRLHDGELTIASAPQKGTTVTITLPETRLSHEPAIAAAL
jgi:signal transduction histidine kinase